MHSVFIFVSLTKLRIDVSREKGVRLIPQLNHLLSHQTSGPLRPKIFQTVGARYTTLLRN